MSQTLLNRVAVVTGAGSGIGRAIAERFVAEGAKVVAFSRDEDRLEKFAARAPARVLAVPGDVTQSGDLERLVAATLRRFGSIDVLVPAAGFARLAPFSQTPTEPDDARRRQMDVHYRGAVETLLCCLPHLENGAAVIFITARLPLAEFPEFGPFHASKAAIAAAARSLASELRPRNVRVNAIAPGPTATRLWERTGLAPDRVQQLLSAIRQRLPNGELGKPEDVAEVAVFLASGASRHIVGQELVVDGGMTLG